MHAGIHGLVSSTGEAAYAVDRAGAIVSWNAAAEVEFGYRQSQALGQRCWQLLRGEDLFGNQYCCERCPHREMARQGRSVKRSRLRFRTASGQQRDFTVSNLVFFEPPGEEILVHLCRPEPEAQIHPGVSLAGHAARGGQRERLTPREQQVLELLGEGLSTRQIASLLSISIPTVRHHVEHILAKLAVHSRLEAVATARRWGLL